MGGAPDTPAGVYAWGGLKAGSEARAAEGDKATMLACSTTQVVLTLTLTVTVTVTVTVTLTLTLTLTLTVILTLTLTLTLTW